MTYFLFCLSHQVYLYLYFPFFDKKKNLSGYARILVDKVHWTADVTATSKFLGRLYHLSIQLLKNLSPDTQTIQFAGPMATSTVRILKVPNNLPFVRACLFHIESKVYKIIDAFELSDGFYRTFVTTPPKTAAIQKAFCRSYDVEDFLDGRYLVTYDYVEGGHEATSAKQFTTLANQLQAFHDENYVHGDVRIENIVFAEIPENTAFLDFDFANEKDSYYPKGYITDRLDRHDDAVEGHPMKPNHDFYSLGEIMKKYKPLSLENQEVWNQYIRSLEEGSTPMLELDFPIVKIAQITN